MKLFKVIIGILLTISFINSSFALSLIQGDYDPTNTTACVNLTSDLRFGDRDSVQYGNIFKLQDYLNDSGFLNAVPTGYFGSATFSAVKKFQSANSLASTGFVGPLTRALVKSKTCGDNVVPPNPNPTDNVLSLKVVYGQAGRYDIEYTWFCPVSVGGYAKIGANNSYLDTQYPVSGKQILASGTRGSVDKDFIGNVMCVDPSGNSINYTKTIKILKAENQIASTTDSNGSFTVNVTNGPNGPDTWSAEYVWQCPSTHNKYGYLGLTYPVSSASGAGQSYAIQNEGASGRKVYAGGSRSATQDLQKTAYVSCANDFGQYKDLSYTFMIEKYTASTTQNINSANISGCEVYGTATIVGNKSGSVYGTDQYADNSELGAASVHAGLVSLAPESFRAEKTSRILVTSVGKLNSFNGSTKNGITSSSYTTPGCGVKLSVADNQPANPYIKRFSHNVSGPIYVTSVTETPKRTVSFVAVASEPVKTVTTLDCKNQTINIIEGDISCSKPYTGQIVRDSYGLIIEGNASVRFAYQSQSTSTVTLRFDVYNESGTVILKTKSVDIVLPSTISPNTTTTNNITNTGSVAGNSSNSFSQLCAASYALAYLCGPSTYCVALGRYATVEQCSQAVSNTGQSTNSSTATPPPFTAPHQPTNPTTPTSPGPTVACPAGAVPVSVISGTSCLCPNGAYVSVNGTCSTSTTPPTISALTLSEVSRNGNNSSVKLTWSCPTSSTKSAIWLQGTTESGQGDIKPIVQASSSLTGETTLQVVIRPSPWKQQYILYCGDGTQYASAQNYAPAYITPTISTNPTTPGASPVTNTNSGVTLTASSNNVKDESVNITYFFDSGKLAILSFSCNGVTMSGAKCSDDLTKNESGTQSVSFKNYSNSPVNVTVRLAVYKNAYDLFYRRDAKTISVNISIQPLNPVTTSASTTSNQNTTAQCVLNPATGLYGVVIAYTQYSQCLAAAASNNASSGSSSNNVGGGGGYNGSNPTYNLQ